MEIKWLRTALRNLDKEAAYIAQEHRRTPRAPSMDRTPEYQRLRRLTDQLLDRHAPGETILEATLALNALFDRLSPIPRDDSEAREEDTRLEQGTAVSPECAAICGLEPLRVARFLQGVDRALETAYHRFPDQPIHLLYAGTGPYGTLVTPLLTRHSPEQLQVTLLDYHDASLDSLRTVLSALGLEAFIKGYVRADATQYQHPADDPIHLVVSETMAAGLANEMQVPITLNLAPQLTDGGLWVPQSIRVRGVIGDPRTLFTPIDYTTPPPYPALEGIVEVGTAFEITKEQAISLAPRRDHDTLPAATLTAPERIEPGHLPFLHTEITIFDDIRLTDRDTTLNLILVFPPELPFREGDRTPLRYRLGNRPGLECDADDPIEPAA